MFIPVVNFLIVLIWWLDAISILKIHGGLSTLLGIIMLAFSEFDFVIKVFPRHFITYIFRNLVFLCGYVGIDYNWPH